jgi:tyrosyl-tRNA synthetase
MHSSLEENPILEYNKYLIFPRIQKFKIEREQKFGGDVTFKDYKSLEKAFLDGNVHPLDLKKNTAEYIIEILKPIRDFSSSNPELLETYKE